MIGLCGIALFFSGFAALAQTTTSTSSSSSDSAAVSTVRDGLATTGSAAGYGNEAQDIALLIAGIIKVALGFLGILILVFIVYAGYIYATSYGEKEKIEKAKKMIANAVIGGVIVVAAYAMASYVIDSLTAIAS